MHIVPKKTGKNLTDIQNMNRALVMETIRENGVTSRAEIAKLTGLQQTTVTNLVAALLSCGIIREATLIKGARGRRSIGLSLNEEQYGLITLRLTRHFILTGLSIPSTSEMPMHSKVIGRVAPSADVVRTLVSKGFYLPTQMMPVHHTMF